MYVWQKLYSIIAQQDVCHTGDIDYKNLFANKSSLGPERAYRNGRDTQGDIHICRHAYICAFIYGRSYDHVYLYTYTTAFIYIHILSYLLHTYIP